MPWAQVIQRDPILLLLGLNLLCQNDFGTIIGIRIRVIAVILKRGPDANNKLQA